MKKQWGSGNSSRARGRGVRCGLHMIRRKTKDYFLNANRFSRSAYYKNYTTTPQPAAGLSGATRVLACRYAGLFECEASIISAALFALARLASAS